MVTLLRDLLALQENLGRSGEFLRRQLQRCSNVLNPKSARVALLGIRKQKKYIPLALALIAELNERGHKRGLDARRQRPGERHDSRRRRPHLQEVPPLREGNLNQLQWTFGTGPGPRASDSARQSL